MSVRPTEGEACHAGRALAHERYPSLLAYAIAFTGQRSTAEDLVQEALIKTFGRPRRFSSAVHAENYVRRAIASVFVDDARRKAVVARTTARLSSQTRADARVTDPAPAIDARGDVPQALQQLPPQVRAVVVLKYYDDFTAAQIADRLGLALGSVKRYLHDGNRQLRDLLAVDLPDSEESGKATATTTVPVTDHARKRR